MTTARNLLERMQSLGVDLTVDGDRIRFKATLDPVPVDLVAALKEHKAAVLSLLRSLPIYDHDTQRALAYWYGTQDQADRLRMHRRATQMRDEDGILGHVAALLSIESERDNFNPRVKLQSLRDPAHLCPADHEGQKVLRREERQNTPSNAVAKKSIGPDMRHPGTL